MSKIESHRIPEQVNYKFENYAAPKYKFSRVPPLSGSQTVSVPLNSTAEVLFEIPTNVHNWAESYLYGVYSFPQQGVGLYTWVHQDGMPLIQEIDLYTRSGIYLCQLPNFQNYMKIVRKLFTPLEEYKTNGYATSFLYPSGCPVNEPPAITPNNGNADVPIEESAYVISSSSMGLVANRQFDLIMNFPMKAIKKTIFALNKDIVFPDILVLRCLFGPANKIGFSSVSGQNPDNAPASLAFALINNQNGQAAPAITCYCVIWNLTLFLAVEKNEDLAQTVRALVNSPWNESID